MSFHTKDERYSKSLSDNGWNESDIMLFDRTALEIINTSRQELTEVDTQNIGFLNLNQDYPQQP